MRTSRFYALALLVSLGPSVLADSNNTLLNQQGVVVSFDEAYHYSLRHTNPAAYEESMSAPFALMRTLENLYVLKRVEQVESSMALISAEAHSFYMADQSARAALRRYLNFHVEQRMSEVDWEGLAKLEYATRLDEFQTEEEVRVEHVLISMEDRLFDDFVNRNSLVQNAIATGVEFHKIATDFSDDPSVETNNGDLGFFRRARMQPSFADAAFAMTEIGEISGPVMTRFGAHYIRLIAKKPPEQIPFERVRDALIAESKKTTEQKIREELLDEFKDEVASDLASIDYEVLLGRFLAAHADDAAKP